MIAGPAWRQGLKLRTLDREGLAAPGVGSSDHLVDEAAVGLEIDEVAAAA
jgi:hypothetical protein